MKLLSYDRDPDTLSIDALAFIGDAVYSLLVREMLCCESSSHADALHNRAVAMVRCEAQARAAYKVLDRLSEKERAIYMRGRNSHNSHVPKNSTVSDYRAATGLEALVGYIYLRGESERLAELFSMMLADDSDKLEKGRTEPDGKA